MYLWETSWWLVRKLVDQVFFFLYSIHTRFQLPRKRRSGSNILGSHSDFNASLSSNWTELDWTGTELGNKSSVPSLKAQQHVIITAFKLNYLTGRSNIVILFSSYLYILLFAVIIGVISTGYAAKGKNCLDLGKNLYYNTAGSVRACACV